MEIADQQSSQNSTSTTTTTATAINPEKFNSFMKQNPICNFYEISKKWLSNDAREWKNAVNRPLL